MMRAGASLTENRFFNNCGGKLFAKTGPILLDSNRGQTHRIVEKRMHSENSYEIYSRPFIRKLREVEPGIEDGGAYRLTGSVIPSLKVAVFSLKTLQRMDR